MLRGMNRADTSRIDAGHHSIDRAQPRKVEAVWYLDWRIRLQDGRLLSKRSQAKTKGEVRARARRAAQELLTAGDGASWKSSSSLPDFIEKVSRPLIAESTTLRASTIVRYESVLGLLVGACDIKEHRHRHSLKGHTIHSGIDYEVLESCLQEISRLHGAGTARHARSILGRYVIRRLMNKRLVAGNPLAGERLELDRTLTDSKPRRGGQALTRDEYKMVIDHLLSMDSADTVEAPKRGPWGIEVRIAIRENLRVLTLLQATTGLRVTEANTLRWRDVNTDNDGHVILSIRDEVSKTKKGRPVPILDSRVADLVLERRNAHGAAADEYVIGSPADASKVWEKQNCRKRCGGFYKELGDELDIPMLLTARTHLWRATLNTMFLDKVPEAVRTAFFGHTSAVNRESYTDISGTLPMLSAAHEGLRLVG